MKKRKGFTLIELLIVIVITVLIFSITFLVINNTTEKVKEKSAMISKKNILAAGKIFTEEFNEEIKWKSNSEETIACVSVEQIIELGLLKKGEVVDEYSDYVIKVIKSEENVNDYQLLEEADCRPKDTKSPIITMSNVTLEIKTDYDIKTGVEFDGTGSNIVRESITLNNETITNTKNLDLGRYNIIYEIEDESGNKVSATRIITIVDTIKPEIKSLNQEPASNGGNWINGNITLTGEASDLGSGIVAYNFSQTKEVENITNWTEIETVESIVKTFEATTKGEWYFHVKDRAGNTESESIQLYIDKTAPTYSSASGSLSSNNIPTATFEDKESGIKETKYVIISGSSSVPEKNHSGFTTRENAKKSFSCGTYYYAYAVAKDKAGNISEVKKIGTYYDECYVYVPPEPTCDWLCQMNQNQNAWHDTNNSSSQDDLHSSNEDLASKNCPTCTYNDDTGKWYYGDGTELPIYGDNKN